MQDKYPVTDYTLAESAKKFFEKIKLSLTVREDNEHVPGRGGNPSELFFILTHNFKIRNTDETVFSVQQIENNEILVKVPEVAAYKILGNGFKIIQIMLRLLKISLLILYF